MRAVEPFHRFSTRLLDRALQRLGIRIIRKLLSELRPALAEELERIDAQHSLTGPIGVLQLENGGCHRVVDGRSRPQLLLNPTEADALLRLSSS
jgi:hypothetical protein